MLLPRYFKFIGLLLVIPSLIIGILFQYAGYVIPFLNYHGGRGHSIISITGQNNFTDELIITTSALGLFFIGFSKQKNEPGSSLNLRLKALFWAVLAETLFISALLIIFNSGLFKFNFIQKYDNAVLTLIINNNPFAILLTFIMRFYYLQYRDKRESKLNYISSRPLVLTARAITIILLVYILIAWLGFIEIKQLNYAIFILLPAIVICVWYGNKTDNEAIELIRLKAMFLSVLLNYGAFILLTWVTYDINYLTVQFINLASVPLIFIPVFYWLKYKHNQNALQAAAI